MITFLIILAWLLSGLVTFRRVGYALESHMRDNNHEFQSLCNACRCDSCGGTYGDHFRWPEMARKKCRDYASSPRLRSMHAATWFSMIPVIALWPFPFIYFVSAPIRAHLNITPKTFFVEPPKPETRQQKRERLSEQRREALEKRNKELEAELKSLGVHLN